MNKQPNWTCDSMGIVAYNIYCFTGNNMPIN